MEQIYIGILAAIIVCVLLLFSYFQTKSEKLVYGPYTTVPQNRRPNNAYYYQTPNLEQIKTFITIRLYYIPDCAKHPLINIFYQALDQLSSHETNKSFKFEAIDATTIDKIEFPINIQLDKNVGNLPMNNRSPKLGNSAYPFIVKIGKNHVVNEYRGISDVGEFMDWVVNYDELSDEGTSCSRCNEMSRYLPEVNYIGSEELSQNLYYGDKIIKVNEKNIS